jgi:hypothetical protein
MTYSNASPLMVHGKNQQGLRWLRLNVSAAEEGEVVMTMVAVAEEGACPVCLFPLNH